jgi:hypothetical protein
VETEQLTIIRVRQITRFWCSQCGDESEFIPVEAVDRTLRMGLSEGNRLLTGDGFHLHKIEDGSVVVCVKSLPNS